MYASSQRGYRTVLAGSDRKVKLPSGLLQFGKIVSKVICC
jgi:hypothetical protein